MEEGGGGGAYCVQPCPLHRWPDASTVSLESESAMTAMRSALFVTMPSCCNTAVPVAAASRLALVIPRIGAGGNIVLSREGDIGVHSQSGGWCEIF